MKDSTPASREIDAIVKSATGWRGKMLAELRAVIMNSAPDIVEQVKWKKPSRPQGVAVWFHEGNLCMADILKNAVRLTFPKGARMKDPKGLFNTRLDSKDVRAIDFDEGAPVNRSALQGLIREAIRLNSHRAGSKPFVDSVPIEH